MRSRRRTERRIFAGALLLVSVASFFAVLHSLDREAPASAQEEAPKTLYTTLPKELPSVATESAYQKVSQKQGDSVIITGVGRINVLFHETGEIISMPLEEYVTGACVAEMLSGAMPEAMKAQCIACRTLAVNLILKKDKSAHLGADICTNPGHCQGFAKREDYLARYKEAGAGLFVESENAARATAGMILVYQSEPIVAAFHSSSGEYTASSREVWGGSVDYLVSVKSPEMYDEQLAASVRSSRTLTRSEFILALKKGGAGDFSAYSDLPFTKWISDISRTESGRVDRLKIGEDYVSGRVITSALGLRCNDFSISFTEDTITFISYGFGHGVGMSQYGAEAMARKGESFYSILSHYYPGTSFGIAE